MANRTNDERRQAVLALHAEGLSMSEIGRRLGCHRTNVKHHLWMASASPVQKSVRWHAIAVKAKARKRRATAEGAA